MQAGGERREQTCFDFLLPKLAALDGVKERDSGGKMEECLPGISRRERAEADFDAKSGRETESRTRLIGRWLGFLVPSVNII